MQNNSIFDKYKTLAITTDDLRDMMEAAGVSFKNKTQYHCPFHGDDKNASGSIKAGKGGNAFFNCFTCGEGGDALSFYKKIYNISNIDAAKKALNHFGESYDDTIADQHLSEDILRKREQTRLRQQAQAAKAAELQKQLINRITAATPTLLKARAELNLNDFIDIFPNQSEHFKLWADYYLGYSHDHESVAIIIRDENGYTQNIKYRLKYKFDPAAKTLTNERMPGKWIGEPNSMQSPFPLSHFLQHTDERVIICEGEKDALNLLSWGANVLTLGGVTNSWEKYSELLRGKQIYIWFDNDTAGYHNAMQRYKELKNITDNIFITLFFKHNRALPSKYDISDFLKENLSVLKSGESVFDLITYFSFKLNNTIVDEIGEFINSDSAKPIDIAPFYENAKIKEWGDIAREIVAKDKKGNYINIFPVKGEMDEAEVDNSRKFMAALPKNNPELVDAMAHQLSTMSGKAFSEAKELALKMIQSCNLTNRILNIYHQTHIVDIVLAFMNSINKLGYSLGEYQRRLYLWNGVHYMAVDPNTIEKFIISHWMDNACVDKKKQTKQNSNEIINNLIVRAEDLDQIKSGPYLKDKRVINMLNGSLIIQKNGSFHFRAKHDKNLAATNVIKANYNPKAKCPKWQRFLNQVMSDPADQATLMEFIGYCLLPSHDYEAFLFLYGKSGSNGKSVIIDVVRSFFGEENVSNLQLQQLHDHELDMLTNKFVNFGSEVDKAGAEKGLNTLKALVSPRDSITINPKNRDAYNLNAENKPKFIFAGNEKPKVAMDNGVFRRMLLLTFDKEITDDKKVRGLSERILDELDGILNWALLGLENLTKNGSFTKSQKMRAEIESYKDEVNPIRRFVKEAIVPAPNYYIPKNYLYSLYLEFLKENGHKGQASKVKFDRDFKDECKMLGENVQEFKKRFGNLRESLRDIEKCYSGIRLNLDFEISAAEVGGYEVSAERMSFYDD